MTPSPNRSCVAWIVALVGMFLAVPAGRAHPLHLSVSEASFNRETRVLEVSLRCFPDDLEAVLSKASGRSVSAADPGVLAAEAAGYLRSTWRLKDREGKPAPLSWTGLDITDSHIWLFFEFPLPQGPEGAAFSLTLLQDLFDDQLNTLVLQEGGRRRTVVFNRSTGEITPFPAPAPKP